MDAPTVRLQHAADFALQNIEIDDVFQNVGGIDDIKARIREWNLPPVIVDNLKGPPGRIVGVCKIDRAHVIPLVSEQPRLLARPPRRSPAPIL